MNGLLEEEIEVIKDGFRKILSTGNYQLHSATLSLISFKREDKTIDFKYKSDRYNYGKFMNLEEIMIEIRGDSFSLEELMREKIPNFSMEEYLNSCYEKYKIGYILSAKKLMEEELFHELTS